jgi:hypothetical protein
MMRLATATSGARLTRQTTTGRLTRQTTTGRLTRQSTSGGARLTRQGTLSKLSWVVWRRKRFEDQVQALSKPSSPWEHGWSLDAPLPAGTGLPAARQAAEIVHQGGVTGADANDSLLTLSPILPPGAASSRMLFTRLPPEFEAVQRDTGEPWLLPGEGLWHPALLASANGSGGSAAKDGANTGANVRSKAAAAAARLGGGRLLPGWAPHGSPEDLAPPEERARRFSKLLIQVDKQRLRLGGDSWFAPLGADPLQQLGRSWGMLRHSNPDALDLDGAGAGAATAAADDLSRPTLARYSLNLEPRQGSSPDSSFSNSFTKSSAGGRAARWTAGTDRTRGGQGAARVTSAAQALALASRPTAPALGTSGADNGHGTWESARNQRRTLTTATNDPMAFSRRLSWIRATARDARSGVTGVIERLSASPAAAAPPARGQTSPEPSRAGGPAVAPRIADGSQRVEDRTVMTNSQTRSPSPSRQRGGGGKKVVLADRSKKRKDSLMTLPGLSRV